MNDVQGDHEPRAGAPELWGGVECTVNRVGDRYYDQIELTGHGARLSDLDSIAEAGVRTLRYPVLWERVAPLGLDRADWRWTDERLARLRMLGVDPIAGLLHHGSGPRYTDLLDPEFPAKLAAYAAMVADRYPFIRRYTVVNEPLTTARFSGLYGHWYPHRKDDRSFVRALLNQCRATVLAMKAIRAIRPDAELVQTEDGGKTYAETPLGYQADFENERRFLTFDLLSGCVIEGHPLYRYLVDSGASSEELAWFDENRCPPGLIGINYYLTSDRFLDPRLDRYPPQFHGGNGRERYADVESVRSPLGAVFGHGPLLELVHARYGLPVAVTEAHLGSMRQEQILWLQDAWRGACAARAKGVDVRAVTLWSWFGCYDWNHLVTRLEGHYEPGAFDVRAPAPRRTALFHAARRITARGTCHHPGVGRDARWRRPQHKAPIELARADRPLLVLGSGTVGQAFRQICSERKQPVILLARRDLDIANPKAIDRVLSRHRPWLVVNAAGFTDVDGAEIHPDRCRRDNTSGAVALASGCARAGIRLVTFSTDLVFDGNSSAPYVESSATKPLCTYGMSKMEAERGVLTEMPEALVVRTSALFCPWDRGNFLTTALAALATGARVRAAADTVVSPTYIADLVSATLDLAFDEEQGIWHLANVGRATWAEVIRRAALLSGLDSRLVIDCPGRELGWRAERPRWSPLATERGAIMPSLEDALVRYCESWDDSMLWERRRVERS